MLSFGFIIDNVVEIPQFYTAEQFQKRIKKVLFNIFFSEIERGCTHFYTSYQNEYTCIVLKAIKQIMDITGVDIKIYVVYPNRKSKNTIDSAINNCTCGCMPAKVTPIIFQEDVIKDDGHFSTTDSINKNRIQFNMLMYIVESCSSIIFYSSDKNIEDNSQVYSIHNYCENYYINHVNVYSKLNH